MASSPGGMSSEVFYGYMYPLQNRRYYLALVFSIFLFPLIAVALFLGTITMIVPAVAFVLWLGTRVFFARMLGNSVLVSAENYPRIQAITEEVKARLGYSKPIYVFVYEQGTFNAYMRHLFFRRAIFLNSELLQAGVSDRETRWLVGRFVGYMRARKQAGVLGWIIRAAQKLLVFNFFILPYERSMVYTGDRLALADIDGDLASATSAMQKLLVGRELGYSINPQGLIAQHREIKGSLFAFLARMGTGFPHTTARYVDLILFTKAFFPEQFKVFEAANPGLPTDLAQLGLSQETDSGTPRVARAPKGWAYAGVTAAVLVAVSWLMWNAVTSISNETDTFASSADAAVVTDAYVPQTSQPPPPPVPSDPVAPPGTHFVAPGKLELNEGCRWMSERPDDLRTICK